MTIAAPDHQREIPKSRGRIEKMTTNSQTAKNPGTAVAGSNGSSPSDVILILGPSLLPLSRMGTKIVITHAATVASGRRLAIRRRCLVRSEGP